MVSKIIKKSITANNVLLIKMKNIATDKTLTIIDIGLKNDGLLHISKISKQFIKHPTDVLAVGEIITCYVDEILLDKKKVSLTMLK